MEVCSVCGVISELRWLPNCSPTPVKGWFGSEINNQRESAYKIWYGSCDMYARVIFWGFHLLAHGLPTITGKIRVLKVLSLQWNDLTKGISMWYGKHSVKSESVIWLAHCSPLTPVKVRAVKCWTHSEINKQRRICVWYRENTNVK